MVELKITENVKGQVSDVYRQMYNALKSVCDDDLDKGFVELYEERGKDDRESFIVVLTAQFENYVEYYYDIAPLSDPDYDLFVAYFKLDSLLRDLDIVKRFDEIGHFLELIKFDYTNKKRIKMRQEWVAWYKEQKPEDRLLYYAWHDKYVKNKESK